MQLPDYPTASDVSDFLKQLHRSGFRGDIEDSYGARITAATDNSVYQVLPQAILYPREGEDISRIVRTMAEQPDAGFSLVARGGGTGTNGQSLNASLVLDTSRYLDRILSIDPAARKVTVEPGVILDQLNDALAPHDLFFPPDVSSGSRATIGGMVATDASGKGSRIYGKTSRWIDRMEVVLADGSDFHVAPQSIEVIGQSGPTAAQKACGKICDLVTTHRDSINEAFPAINRGLTGYNLKQLISDDGVFRLSYLLAGSEGTLALTKSVTLRVIPRPRFKALMVVVYDSFDQTLAHVSPLLQAEPVAIEVLDDHILKTAQQDMVWQDVEVSFRAFDLQRPIRGLSFIEINAESDAELQQRCDAMKAVIDATGKAHGVMGMQLQTDAAAIAGLWSIRRRAVGLLGATSLGKERRPIAFVEDTAVPPDQLPDYIQAFRQLLQSHGLQYGMYGHADVGCLHVRPALDMRQPDDQQLLRTISDEVAALVQRFGGVFWGEHGRGFRGEYAPLFFGPELYPLLGEIKAILDPHNRFNPGKLAAPVTLEGARVKRIDEIPFRGSFDAQIKPDDSKAYHSAIACNGNAVCQNQTIDDAMCPSYKATHDKRYSPKGRASMLREWLRLGAAPTPEQRPMFDSLEKELYGSLHACLSCQSCAHSCPIKVDIPDLKSQFLQRYHQKQRRPFSDYLFARFETFAAFGRRFPGLSNWLLHNPITTSLLAQLGLVSLPQFSRFRESALNTQLITPDSIDKLPAKSLEKAVILLPDSFNASFDSPVLQAACQVINALGYRVLLPPVMPNGKALHVKGFRRQFAKAARKQQVAMRQLAASGLPILSLEIATTLLHRREYPAIAGEPAGYCIQPIESWLVDVLPTSTATEGADATGNVHLFPHCMEQTANKQSSADWATLLGRLGIPVSIKTAGCCGMSGLFGHERGNHELSQKIFHQNWQPRLETDAVTLATGFSCRCQLRDHGEPVQHPLELLAQQLDTSTEVTSS